MKFGKLLCKITAVMTSACMLIPAACGGKPEQPGGEEPVKVESVELSRATLTLNVGADATLTYTVFPEEAVAEEAKWRSSDAAVATVSGGAVHGVAEGEATIRLTVGEASASCKVTVVDKSSAAVPANGITLDNQYIVLEPGETSQLTATVTPDNADDKTVTWTTNNNGVATVGETGLVTAIGNGTAVITATTVNRISARCVVQVASEQEEKPAPSEGIYVAKVQSLEGRDDFIMGMDASAVPSLEAARKTNGLSYKNFAGETQDVFEILKDNGITDIRIRIWNNPNDEQGRTYGGGKCDLQNAVAISTRCQKAGLGVIIDFHYSDFWADPGKQTAPKAWKSYNTQQMADAIYNFTKSSLTAIKETGVKITMVQIGNETTDGLCGTTGGWSTHAETICKYMQRGSEAVREVTKTPAEGGAKVAVHFTNPEHGGYTGYAAYLKEYNVDYDVFGSSYYPYWHGTLANLATQLSAVHKSYGKEVMVLETSYAFTKTDADGCGNTGLDTITEPITVQGQSNAVRNVIETIANLGSWGLGICYWEGTWIAASASSNGDTNRRLCTTYGCGWATSYARSYDSSATNDGGCVIDNQAFFKSDGTPLDSLKVFKLVYEGTDDVDVTADSCEDQEVYYTVNEGPIVLPDTVQITLNNGSTLVVQAMWKVTQDQLDEYIRTAGSYVVTGTTLYGGTCTCTVWVSNPNILVDGGFEDCRAYGSTDNFIQGNQLSNWVIEHDPGTSALQLYVSNDSGNAEMGKNSFHFWDDGDVSFRLYQEVDIAEFLEYGYGTYGCSFDIMGGDGINMDIYAYITVHYKDKADWTTKGNKVTLDGWLDWARTSVSGVKIDDTVTGVRVGISVTAKKTGAGPWGNIDNAQLYLEEKD